MTVFVDSSALVKLYVPEEGHESIRALAGPLLVCQLARVEVPAAFWRKHRLGQLGAGDASILVSAFEFDYFGDDGTAPRFTVVALAAAVLDVAARHAARHGLRAYDAVQLACATAARGAVPSLRSVAALDHDLRRAAAAEGFGLVPAPV